MTSNNSSSSNGGDSTSTTSETTTTERMNSPQQMSLTVNNNQPQASVSTQCEIELADIKDNQISPNSAEEHIKSSETRTPSDCDDVLSTTAEVNFDCQSPMKKPTSKCDFEIPTSPQSLNPAGSSTTNLISDDKLVKKLPNNSKSVTMITQEEQAFDTKTVNSYQSKATSKTSKTSGGFSVATCCGTVELNCIRVLSILGMMINIIAFVAMAVVISVAFSVSTTNETELLILRADANLMSEVAASSLKIAVYSNQTEPYISRWKTTKDKAVAAIASIVDALPPDVFLRLLNGSTYFNSSAIPVNPYEQQVVNLLKSGKQKEAITLIESKNYTSYSLGWKNVVSNLLTYAKELARNKNDYLLTSSSVNMGLIGFSILLVVPIVLAIFIMAINREGVSQKRLKKANAVMLLDTLQDHALKALFRKHCETERCLESFEFLEKIHYYKEFCNDSFDIQVKLYDSSHPTQTEKKSLESDLKEVEQKKYEVAFEIFTEFIDEHGEKALVVTSHLCEDVKMKLDHFNTGQSDHLSDELFDKLQTEVAIHLLDCHARFKQSIAFQKKMKIQDIRSKTKITGK
ncbi:RGS domain-containing protein [Naegleria gruberi]|uniref:RGS domain-containing protein n=1 Tax=Naegleria gruberi TaxID=5762 RepID=D2W391_NAEGR|nr:RGS domain-containing protein [Naegleria gruberi]EFC36451.1 RGS domain-containing protein [Naegleria gruberi]|eukprot:XP_002669195.1 RGS domain-containing protein [Naegleria gruberi strain NEG-M]